VNVGTARGRRVAISPLRALAVVAGVLALVGVAGAATQDRADDARSRAAEARQQEQALAGDIAVQSERIDVLEADIGGLQHELAGLERDLDRARSRLRALEDELAEKTRILVRAREQLRLAQAHLSRRLVEIYTTETPDALGVALGAQSLDEVLDLLDAQSRVVESDTRLVDQIHGLRARMTRERARAAQLRRRQAAETARVERRTNERRAAVASLVASRDSLVEVRSAREQALASIQVERGHWEAEAEALEAQSRQVAAVIAATPPVAPAAATTSAAPSSTGFVWPAAGSLVSPYGQRWGRLHAGIDIAAPAGTPVVASAAGQVVHAGSMGGYGLLVVIQHAGGISTAYAHNSSLAVVTGQSVAQGQTIAAVGCTGSCSGDHLHFEVRVGGSAVDPMAYL
jgi:murein DD-endopeptidase MepM/ murein hydrolase activator NlpD